MRYIQIGISRVRLPAWILAPAGVNFMDKDSKQLEEIYSAMDQLEHEVKVLAHAVDDIDKDYDEEYARKIMRAELQEIGELIESFAEIVGEGEAISITTPELSDEDNETR